MAVCNQISWISLLQLFYGCVTIEHNPLWEGMLVMLMVILFSGQVGLGKDLTQREAGRRVCGIWGISLWKYCLWDSTGCHHGRLIPCSTPPHSQPLPGHSEMCPQP